MTADPHTEIWIKRRDMVRREQDERMALLKDHSEKFAAERASLKSECAVIGHERGRYWDNGLGWEWYYCKHCDARMDDNYYGPADQTEEDKP